MRKTLAKLQLTKIYKNRRYYTSSLSAITLPQLRLSEDEKRKLICKRKWIVLSCTFQINHAPFLSVLPRRIYSFFGVYHTVHSIRIISGRYIIIICSPVVTLFMALERFATMNSVEQCLHSEAYVQLRPNSILGYGK